MRRALEFLYSLKALDEGAKLTRPLGMWMAEMPVEPMMAAIVSLEVLLGVWKSRREQGTTMLLTN